MPVREFAAKRIMQHIKIQPSTKPFGYTRDDTFFVKLARLSLRAVTDGYDLRGGCNGEILVKIKDDRWSLTDFTMLHYVQLPQPRLVERVAGRVDDVT